MLSGKSSETGSNKKEGNKGELSASAKKRDESTANKASIQETDSSEAASASNSVENEGDENDDHEFSKVYFSMKLITGINCDLLFPLFPFQIVSGGCPDDWRESYMKLYRYCVNQRQQRGNKLSKKKELEEEVASLRNQLLRLEQRHKDTEQKLRMEKVSHFVQPRGKYVFCVQATET